MPIGNLGNAATTGSDVQDVRLVCNRWGRCWRTGRYYGPRYRPYYGYGYGYPAYGYGYGRPYWGRPGIGFGFRF
jgi:hypothetical protein